MPNGVVRVGEHARVNVAVRADERQVGYLVVEMLRDFFLLWIGAKVAVVGQMSFGPAWHEKVLS